MSDLYLSPTRRRRLEAVGRGEIYVEAGNAWDRITGFKVTDAMAEMERAGWVTRGRHPTLHGCQAYAITETGRGILNAAPVDELHLGTIWRDRQNPGRRLRVVDVTARYVEAQVTYSTEPDAWQYAAANDRVARTSWTAHRYLPEPTGDGAA